MSEPEFIDVWEGPSVADERWAAQMAQNGSHPDPEPSSWTPLNLAELEERPPVEPTLGGLGFVYPGKRHVFSGPQESAKTLVAYVVLIEVIRAGGSAVLIDFEMGRYDARNRLRELGATPEELASVAFVEPQEPITRPASDALVALAPDLVLIDASAGAFVLEGLDDNKRGDVERFAQRYVDPFRRAEIATVTIDHVTKNVETRGNYAIGSERKVGQTDVHLGFTVVHPIKRGDRGVYKVTTHKDRVGFLKRGKLGEFELVSDAETHDLTWAFTPATDTDEEHPFRPTVKMEQASQWLEKQLEERVPMSHIENGIGGDRDAGRLAIQTLIDEGYFLEEQGPRKARLMTLVRPYRQQYDEHLSTSPLTSPHLSGEVAQNDLSASPFSLGTERSGGVVSDSGEVDSPQPSEDDDGIPF